MKREFQAKLMSKGPGGAWTYLSVPFDVQDAFGSKSRVSVKGTINGHPFYNSLMPEGDGTHSMMVNKQLQAAAKARAGDSVQVSLEVDTSRRKVEVPQDLRHALRAGTEAASFFNGLTFSQKNEYVDWISSARQSTTRANRIKRAIEMLLAGKKRIR
jgi:Domain of unknown function (DUF1905)/Bacteriocin-protection, YdeI or OmpD-Associated